MNRRNLIAGIAGLFTGVALPKPKPEPEPEPPIELSDEDVQRIADAVWSQPISTSETLWDTRHRFGSDKS